MNTQTSEILFKEYRMKVEMAADQYNKIATDYPGASFPTLSAQVQRMGMLAEIWGTIATLLSKKGINYLANWREGK